MSELAFLDCFVAGQSLEQPNFEMLLESRFEKPWVVLEENHIEAAGVKGTYLKVSAANIEQDM